MNRNGNKAHYIRGEFLCCAYRKGFSRISWKHLEQMRCVLPYTIEEEQEEIPERVIVSRRHRLELTPRENSKESQTESVSSEVGMLLFITNSFMLI